MKESTKAVRQRSSQYLTRGTLTTSQNLVQQGLIDEIAHISETLETMSLALGGPPSSRDGVGLRKWSKKWLGAIPSYDGDHVSEVKHNLADAEALESMRREIDVMKQKQLLILEKMRSLNFA